MVCQIPSELAEKSCQVLGELVGRSANVADSGPQRNSLFMYLQKSIQFWGVWSQPDAVVCIYLL